MVSCAGSLLTHFFFLILLVLFPSVHIRNRAYAWSHCPLALCLLTAAVNELPWHRWETPLLSFMFIFHICAVAQHTQLFTRALPFLGWCFVSLVCLFKKKKNTVRSWGVLVSDAWNEMLVVRVLIGCSNRLHVHSSAVQNVYLFSKRIV